jgi:hypothetical protein
MWELQDICAEIKLKEEVEWTSIVVKDVEVPNI